MSIHGRGAGMTACPKPILFIVVTHLCRPVDHRFLALRGDWPLVLSLLPLHKLFRLQVSLPPPTKKTHKKDAQKQTHEKKKTQRNKSVPGRQEENTYRTMSILFIYIYIYIAVARNSRSRILETAVNLCAFGMFRSKPRKPPVPTSFFPEVN